MTQEMQLGYVRMFFMPVKPARLEETELTFHINYPALRDDLSQIFSAQVSNYWTALYHSPMKYALQIFFIKGTLFIFLQPGVKSCLRGPRPSDFLPYALGICPSFSFLSVQKCYYFIIFDFPKKTFLRFSHTIFWACQ